MTWRAAGARGFGKLVRKAGTGKANARTSSVTVSDDAKTMRFYDYLRTASFPKVALAEIPLPESSERIRGVVATAPIAAGEVICSIPLELAVSLGTEGDDPSLPAVTLMQMLQDEKRAREYEAYFAVLPEEPACRITTDYYSEQELAALWHPPTVEETQRRLARVRHTFRSAVWKGDADADDEELLRDPAARDAFAQFQRCVYLIVSRTLSVRRRYETRRFLIPLVDMVNCDIYSKNEMRYESQRDAFELVAGQAIPPGEQVTLVYGGGALTNDRFVQDYGFVVPDNPADRLLFMPRATGDSRSHPSASLSEAEFRNEVARRCEEVLALAERETAAVSKRVEVFNRQLLRTARDILKRVRPGQ